MLKITFLFVSWLASCVGQASFGELVLIPDASSRGAVCIDGSPAGYYYQPGSGDGREGWIFHFQGGAWCYDEEWCARRSRTVRGSSLEWEQTFPFGGMLSDNPVYNPDFHNWHKVFFRYCDGGSFSGTAEEPVIVDGVPLYFRGRYILDAILELLLDQGLRESSRLIVSGCSAGGLASTAQVDRIKSKLPPSISVVSMVDGGYFVDIQPVAGSTEPYVGDLMRNAFYLQNLTFDDDCMNHFSRDEQWRCFFSSEMASFVSVPQFIYHSGYDLWQTDCHLWLTCRPPQQCGQADVVAYNKFYVDWVQGLKPITDNPVNGWFVPSCIVHCMMNSNGWWAQSPALGQTAAQTFGNWYFHRNETEFGARSIFDCGYPCNDLCFQRDGSTGCVID